MALGDPQSVAYARAAAAIQRAVLDDSSSSTLYASGLIDLRLAEDSRAALDRAVTVFEQARVRDSTNRALLNDLAVSYLAVGERDQALLPMLRALDAVDAALGQDSAYVPALFNRALILQRLFLTKSAAAAWSRYATADHDESWKPEAQAHRRALSHLEDSLAFRFFAQRARDRTFMLLGQWGAAIESGDRSRAAGLLGQAVALTDSLGGVRDRSALMTVTWLRAQASRATVDPRVARGLVDLADGIALHDRGSYEAGESVLASAERSLREVGSPAARWAAFYRAACEANQAKFAVSDARLQRTIREATRHEPALVGKATWVRGVIQLRQGNYEYANRLYEEARSLFVVAGDAMNEAAVSFLLAEGYALAGQTAASEREAYTGLRGLAPFRRSRYLSNLLMGVASHARESRLRLATLDVLSEVLTVVEELRVPTTIAYVRRTRGADLAAAGDTIQAFSELDSAAAAAARASGTMGARVAADVDLVRGRLLLHRDREAARRALDHAVTTYRTINAVNALPAALYQSALLASAEGDKEAARRALAEAVSVIEHRRASFTSADARAAYDETIENVFDATIDLELELGRADVAYELLERARMAVRPPHNESQPTNDVAPLKSLVGSLPEGVLLIAYGVFENRIVMWSIRRGAWRVHSVSQTRETVARLASAAVREMHLAGPGEANTRLFDLLLRPMTAEWRGARALIVVPDRELGVVPFAALRDSSTGRYVVEDVAVLTEPSATFFFAASQMNALRARTLSALVVGNPAVRIDSGDSLADLPGAAAEAEHVAATYGQRELLTDKAANRETVLHRLPQHSVFHFAGHAVFDGARPERSYLALHDPNGAGNGRLEAWEIARLSLSNMKVVVLSACRTLPGRPTHSGSVSGIAFSFLRAGAPAIVSTLWDIADDGAAGLMVAFHQAVRDGVPPPEALRRAQLMTLRSNGGRERATVWWAAFVYTGPWVVNTRSD